MFLQCHALILLTRFAIVNMHGAVIPGVGVEGGVGALLEKSFNFISFDLSYCSYHWSLDKGEVYL